MAVIDGVVLEGGFVTRDGRTVLITSDDTPFEERVHLTALDGNGTRLDRYRIGWPYTPGVVANIRTAKDALSFAFAGDLFRVTLRSRPSLILPGLQDNGVLRRMPPWAPAHARIERGTGEGA